jgi:predicted nucleic acid-binding protein
VTAIYLDANVMFLAFERPRDEGAFIWPVLDAIEAGDFAAKTSQVTLAELLPRPLMLGQTDLAAQYENLFRSRSIFEALPITLEILSEAAHIRAQRVSIPLPDAIHLATARLARCAAFLPADKRLMSFDALAMVPLGPTCLADLRSRFA